MAEKRKFFLHNIWPELRPIYPLQQQRQNLKPTEQFDLNERASRLSVKEADDRVGPKTHKNASLAARQLSTRNAKAFEGRPAGVP
jgi:hypothetical protein